MPNALGIGLDERNNVIEITVNIADEAAAKAYYLQKYGDRVSLNTTNATAYLPQTDGVTPPQTGGAPSYFAAVLLLGAACAALAGNGKHEAVKQKLRAKQGMRSFLFVQHREGASARELRQKRARAFVLRVVDDIFGLALLHDHAACHKDHAVGHAAGKGHLMCHDEHGHLFFGERLDHTQDISGQLRVKRAGWLIEKSIFGPIASARAMETRCCSPPESW